MSARARNLVAFAAAWLAAILAIYEDVVGHPRLDDAQVYWSAWHGPLYAGGFVYPPAGALLFAPAAVLPWPAFAVGWLAVLVGAALWLLWPLRPALRLPLFLGLAATMAWGNAAILLAVPLALAPRWPVLWTVLAWTKVTPAVGAVSLLRARRWRDAAIVVLAVVAVGLAVLIVAPDTVPAWLAQLRAHPAIPAFWMFPDPGIVVRLFVAALIAWWGASRPWTLAVAAAVATPDLGLATLGLLAAVPRLREADPVPDARRNPEVRPVLRIAEDAH